ncbi:hypothetical protein P879_02595 [Paragonimus westermani]|uniref:Uncharacterized protein n=1 Tax=Paragonimus westermani TaxID=34504 RepID=A0A8T0DVH5_9TREM|nr:hypothetical protein P879_02595 [Paragonimus westermani]
MEGFNCYWREVVEEPAFQDEHAPGEIMPTDLSLLRPIAAAEITTTLATLKGYSPLMEKATTAQLQKRNAGTVIAF